jgi:hypothetical protein
MIRSFGRGAGAHRWWLLVGLLCVLLPATAGVLVVRSRVDCPFGGFDCHGRPICNPRALQVTPSADLHRGQLVIIWSNGYACKHSPVSGVERISESYSNGLISSPTRAIVASDGSFEATVRIQPDAPLGPALFVASCPTDIHGKQGSCAAYVVAITVTVGPG